MTSSNGHASCSRISRNRSRTTSRTEQEVWMAYEGSHHAVLAPDDREATLFDVLARQARRNSAGQLATTAIGGMMNAAFLMQRTSLWWLAAAYWAVSAYGTWGLLDQWYMRLHRVD